MDNVLGSWQNKVPGSNPSWTHAAFHFYSEVGISKSLVGNFTWNAPVERTSTLVTPTLQKPTCLGR